MDLTYEYLWAAGYDLPPEDRAYQGGKPLVGALSSDLKFGVFVPAPPISRRGKKAARAKRQKGQKP